MTGIGSRSCTKSVTDNVAHDDVGKRDLNQAVFRRIYIMDDEVVGSDLTPVFQKMLHEDVKAILDQEVPRSTNVASRSPSLFVVRPDGDETSSEAVHPSGMLRARGERPATEAHNGPRGRRERPRGPLAWEGKNPGPHSEDQGSNVFLLVGVKGLEPST